MELSASVCPFRFAWVSKTFREMPNIVGGQAKGKGINKKVNIISEVSLH